VGNRSSVLKSGARRSMTPGEMIRLSVLAILLAAVTALAGEQS
jgi:hypothetical protein